MPVYDDDFGGRCVHLGYGDIVISPSGTKPGAENQDELVFVKAGETAPIGDSAPHIDGETSATISIPVRIVFDCIESLDVLIEQAQVLRTRFVARAEQAPTPLPTQEGGA